MFSLFLQDAWKVLLYSLLLGAGLPVVYALGVRSLGLASDGASAGTTDGTPDGTTDGTTDGGAPRRHPLGVALATVCFVVVLVGVAVGLLYIVAAGQGKMLSFEHLYPTIVPKS